jgi:hypothetical protein
VESIYYVMSWLCHRRCRHCYEERFRPYAGDEFKSVVEEAQQCFPRVIANLPERMTYLDAAAGPGEHRGRIILAGGEILLDPIRETVLYPALEMLAAKYRDKGGVKLIVQTTGDTLRPKMVEELLARDVWMISVSGIDSFHEGLETIGAQQAMVDKLTKMFDAAGMTPFEHVADKTGDAAEEGRHYQFFGAQPGTWIGQLWPRGRAWANGLSTATINDNFCNQWSGGLNFLQYKQRGSEVSIEPNGNVYPCCAKTKKPVGSLLEEPLEAILERLQGNPVYEAISMGHPERMGIARGWTVERFLEESTVTRPDGSRYQNLCIGCDRFHDAFL